MRLLKISTAYDLMIFMADSSDHVTGKTGLTLTITASKQGGNFSGISPTVTERANGWYEVALTSSETDTLGDLCLHITGTAADPTDVAAQVIAVDFADAVRGGMSALPNAAANASGGLAILDGNGDIVAGITGDVLGRIIGGGATPFSAAGVWAARDAAENALALENTLSNINSAIGAFSGSGNNTILGVLKAIASKAASLPSDIGGTFDPATDSLEGQVDVALAAILADSNELQTDLVNGGRLDLLIDAIKAKTDTIPTFPSNFAALGINASGHVSQVTLVDTTTTATTATNLTNLPAITANWLTAAGVAADAATEIAAAVQLSIDTNGVQITDGAISSAAFTVAAVDGVETGILEQIVQLWRRFFKKSTLTSTQLKTYADDGTTVITTQTVSDDATTQTQGVSS